LTKYKYVQSKHLALHAAQYLDLKSDSYAEGFSGVLSDRLKHRKNLIIVRYGLSALAKPLFVLAK
jgi:hypothetical protein